MLKQCKFRFALAVAVFGLVSLSVWADSLELRNGSIIKGRYLGGTDSEVSFKVGSSVQHYPLADIVSLSFDEASRTSALPQTQPAATLPQQPEAAPTPRPALVPRPATPATSPSVSGGGINVPAGTRLLVRTVDAIDSDRNQVGDKFQATLEQPLVVNDVTVAPKGASVYGRLSQATEAGHIQGRSQLKLELTALVVNEQRVSLVTGAYSVSGSSRGASTAKRAGGGAALGAVIGAIAGGGKGAAIGAGVGAGAGTAVQVMTKGEQVHVPSETLLEFELQEPATVPAGVASSSAR